MQRPEDKFIFKFQLHLPCFSGSSRRRPSFTAFASGNAAATSGSSRTRFIPSRWHSTYLPRTPPLRKFILRPQIVLFVRFNSFHKTFCCLLSAVCCLLSAVCCLLSAACCLLCYACLTPRITSGIVAFFPAINMPT